MARSCLTPRTQARAHLTVVKIFDCNQAKRSVTRRGENIGRWRVPSCSNLSLCNKSLAPCWQAQLGVSSLSMVSDELERLKAEGNTLYQQGQYEEAVQKYDVALGGPESTGDDMALGISTALLLNRSACHLVLADRAPSGVSGVGVGGEAQPGSKLAMYCSAVDDAHNALIGLRMVGSPLLAKALCRCGRGQLGMCAEKVATMDHTAALCRAEGTLNAEALVGGLRHIATGRNGLDEAAMHLGESLELAPDDASVKKYLKKVQQLQAKLAARGAPPASQAVPEPQPAAFAPDVVFTPGASWMANQVALEIPLRPPPPRGGEERALPVYLQKQRNTNNLGELAIWIMYSG